MSSGEGQWTCFGLAFGAGDTRNEDHETRMGCQRYTDCIFCAASMTNCGW
ncbi:hypothetical protein ACFFX0_14315 [Citricoccus parietis]|uniref:Uncharacterized protein n=1 Tax=Citricoccus parietis TaxID=592307 RepID=A0ABV5G045_9MICC